MGRGLFFWIFGIVLLAGMVLFVKIPMTIVVGDKPVLYEPSYLYVEGQPDHRTLYFFSKGKIFEIEKRSRPESSYPGRGAFVDPVNGI